MTDRDRSGSVAQEVADSTPGVETRPGEGQDLLDETSRSEQTPVGVALGAEAQAEDEPDYRDLYMRERAEGENLRKRMLKQKHEAVAYATKDLAKRLVPVIDHFNLAIEHGEGGSGVQLALKELLDALAQEGLEEIAVEPGEAFDPNIHNALTTITDPTVDSDVVAELHRKGYRFKEHVLRAPEVVVAQPADAQR
jgi:molecular chaperone GrpE